MVLVDRYDDERKQKKSVIIFSSYTMKRRSRNEIKNLPRNKNNFHDSSNVG